MTMTGVVKIGSDRDKGKLSRDSLLTPATIKAFNRRLGAEIRRKKGLSDTYERSKEQ